MPQTWQIYLVAACGVVGLFAFFWWLSRRVQAQDGDADNPVLETAHDAPQRVTVDLPLHAVKRPTVPTGEIPSKRGVQNDPPVPLPLHLWTKLVEMVPHAAILGPTNSGKTTLAEAILRKLLEMDASRKAVILDPKWKQHTPPKWGGLPAAMLDDQGGYQQIAAVLRSLFGEFRLRVKRLQRGEPLGADLMIVWDEINDAMEEISGLAGVVLRRGLRIWREYRLKLIIFPQSDRVEALGLKGHGDARNNLLWFYLGEAAIDKARELERQKVVGPDFLPVIAGMQRPALMVYQGSRAWPIETYEAPTLASQPIEASRAWSFPQLDEEQPVLTGGSWTEQHLKVAAWLGEAMPRIREGMAEGKSYDAARQKVLSDRELARRLFEGKSDGTYSERAKAIRLAVERVMGFATSVGVTAHLTAPVTEGVTAVTEREEQTALQVTALQRAGTPSANHLHRTAVQPSTA